MNKFSITVKYDIMNVTVYTSNNLMLHNFSFKILVWCTYSCNFSRIRGVLI